MLKGVYKSTVFHTLLNMHCCARLFVDMYFEAFDTKPKTPQPETLKPESQLSADQNPEP